MTMGATPPSEEAEYTAKLAIVQLDLLRDSSEESALPSHILFRCEGGQALFTLPLSSLFSCSEEGLQSFSFDRPILHAHVQDATKGAPLRIFVSLDCRQETKALQGDALAAQGDVLALAFEDGKIRLDEVTQPKLEALQSTSSERSKGASSISTRSQGDR